MSALHKVNLLSFVLYKVPRVEGLTVRVVSSADRVLQVQPRFHEFFKQEKYPGAFPYKSKVGACWLIT
jgi:hypothetical protein